MDDVFLITGNDVAWKITIDMWQSSDGRLFMDEASARYHGCTHRPCNTCGEPARKMYTHCDLCRAESTRRRYSRLEGKAWDESNPVCTYDDDRYFFSLDEIEDYCDEFECSIDDLMLVHCAPQYAFELYPDEIYEDILSEDCDVPPNIESAFAALNRTIIESDEILSWVPSDIAVVVFL